MSEYMPSQVFEVPTEIDDTGDFVRTSEKDEIHKVVSEWAELFGYSINVDYEPVMIDGDNGKVGIEIYTDCVNVRCTTRKIAHRSEYEVDFVGIVDNDLVIVDKDGIGVRVCKKTFAPDLEGVDERLSQLESYIEKHSDVSLEEAYSG